MSIRVEGGELIIHKWINQIQYQPETEMHMATAFIFTDDGVFTVEGEKAKELKNHHLIREPNPYAPKE